MLITNTETISGKTITKTLGVVKGNTIRARWFGRDILAVLKTIIGGEIKSYTNMLNDAREEATNRMIDEAKKHKADAIVNVRYTTSTVMQGASEILAYGTAVQFKK
ncbi:MAG: YbjQ family protein [Candidatus Woesearchaeota archaeon]